MAPPNVDTKGVALVILTTLVLPFFVGHLVEN